ncbi:hypothetical protein GQX74_006191 [Glossina fuscipes]|nr:hypothetical protein GQX74_006191 [Glossina fuscipes]
MPSPNVMGNSTVIDGNYNNCVYGNKCPKPLKQLHGADVANDRKNTNENRTNLYITVGYCHHLIYFKFTNLHICNNTEAEHFYAMQSVPFMDVAFYACVINSAFCLISTAMAHGLGNCYLTL